MPRPKGGYRNREGKQIPGCTTIISRFKDSGALLYWAFNQGKNGATSLYEKTDEAAEIGTLTHAKFEAHRKGLPVPDSLPGMSKDQIDKAENAFLAALEWEKQVEIKSVAVEVSLVCECYQYGCTIDEIALIRGKLEDFEWKTSSGIWVDHLLQVAAQKHAWECNHPDRKLNGGSIVRFNKETGDFAYHHYTNLSVPFHQFCRFRGAYEDDYKLKKMV